MKWSFLYHSLLLLCLAMMHSACDSCKGETETYLPPQQLAIKNATEDTLFFQSNLDQSIDTFMVNFNSVSRAIEYWDDNGDLESDCQNYYDQVKYAISSISEGTPERTFDINLASDDGRYGSEANIRVNSDFFYAFRASPPISIGSHTCTNVIYVDIPANLSSMSRLYYDYAHGFIQYEYHSGELWQRMP